MQFVSKDKAGVWACVFHGSSLCSHCGRYAALCAPARAGGQTLRLEVAAHAHSAGTGAAGCSCSPPPPLPLPLPPLLTLEGGGLPPAARL